MTERGCRVGPVIVGRPVSTAGSMSVGAGSTEAIGENAAVAVE